MLLFPAFYKQYGIVRPQQLVNPRTFAFDLLQLPRNAILHYFDDTHMTVGPSAQDPYFRTIKKRIPIHYKTKLRHVAIGGRGLNKPLQPFIHEHSSKEPQFKFMPRIDWKAVDGGVPVVYSYALLSRLYQYQQKPMAAYQQWRDQRLTWWATVCELAKETDDQQFLPVIIPPNFPPQAAFRQYEVKRTPAFLSQFTTPDLWFLHELWCWLSVNPEKQSIFTSTAIEDYSKLNLILFFNSRWCILNLGYVAQWVIGFQQDATATASLMSPVQMQKLLLKLYLSLQAPNETPPTPRESPVSPTPSTIVDSIPSSNSLPNPDPLSDDDAVSMAAIFDEADETLNAADVLSDLPVRHHRLLSGLTSISPLTNSQTTDATPAWVSNDTPETVRALIQYDPTPTDILQDAVYTAAEEDRLTAIEYRALHKEIEKAEKLTAPQNSTETLAHYVAIPQSALVLTKTPLPGTEHLPDATMRYSSLKEFDQRYIQEILPKDIAAAVHAIQKTGVILKDYQVERETSVLGAFEVHTLSLRPIGGAPSTIRFKLPVVNGNGEYMVNGKKQRQRKQRGDLPIRKVDASTVTLTSYYAKLFVRRSEKKVNDTYAWISEQIRVKGLLGNDPRVLNIVPVNVFDNTAVVPRVYSGMAHSFKSITFPGFKLQFEYGQRTELFGVEKTRDLEKDGHIVAGRTATGQPIVVDALNRFYTIGTHADTLLGTLPDLAGLDQSKMPLDYTVLRVFRRDIPLALIFGYFLGFSRLLLLLDAQPRRVEGKTRATLVADEWAIRLKDVTFVFKRSQQAASLLLAGFRDVKRTLVQYTLAQLDTPDVYFNLLETKEPSARHLRELDLMQAAFVDPITRDVLIDLKEPTTFLGLLERANTLLVTDAHPDTYSLAAQRIKGYERFSGAVYSELMKSVRDYRGRSNQARAKIEMSPYAVWQAITQDPANMLVADINPLENLKQSEAITYGGNGGRGSESMTKALRAFNIDDMGTISESTTDSKDVGVNVFTSANPLFTSLRGMTERFDPEKHGAANLLSTPALASVGAMHDDPKRVNFISIQHSHVIPCDSYHQPLVRTGYEEVIAHRTTALFAYIAPKNGTVVSKTDNGIVLEFEDGERVGVALGRIYGQAEGTTYPHDVISTWDTGAVFSAGAPIAYNTGFFEPDILDPKRIVWKTAMLVKTALYETTQTFEDSSAISAETAKKLMTQKLEVRTFVVDFKQGVKQVAMPGTAVQPTDVLLLIEDELTASYDLFDEKNLDTLRLIANKAPKAKCFGTIDRVEVYYHGSKVDMSESLLKLTRFSDKRLAERALAIGEPKVTGEVNSEYRVEGSPLELDTAEIRISILIKSGAGVGDKGVFAHQMKSVIGEVMDYPMTTEQGEPIDAVFGYRSIANRVVLSPELLGTTNTLLRVIQQRAIDLYESQE